MKIVSHSKKHKRRRKIAVAGAVSLLPVTGYMIGNARMESTARVSFEVLPAEESAEVTCVEPVTTPILENSDAMVQLAEENRPWADMSSEYVKRELGKKGIELVVVTADAYPATALPLEPDKYTPLGIGEKPGNPVEIFKAVSLFPPEIIGQLRPRMHIVDKMDTSSHIHLGDAAGMYFGIVMEGGGYSEIAVQSRESYAIYVHELAHALQTILCRQGSRYMARAEELQSSGKLTRYLNDMKITVQPWVSEIWEGRQFTEAYGAQSHGENWATMFTELLISRGVVLEGDDDWGSPYHQMQTAMIEDIEARFPGFMRSITDTTILNRVSPLGAYNKHLAEDIEFKHKLHASYEDYAREEYGFRKLFETNPSPRFNYLQDTTVVFVDPETAFPDFNAKVISDPVVLEDRVGHIYLGYVDPLSGFVVTAYDPKKMTVYSEGELNLVSTESSVVSGDINTALFVDNKPVATLSTRLTPDTTFATYRELFYTQKQSKPKDVLMVIDPF